MRLILTLTGLLALAACGVDGEPTTPTKSADPKPGVTLSGTANAGVSKRW